MCRNSFKILSNSREFRNTKLSNFSGLQKSVNERQHILVNIS